MPAKSLLRRRAVAAVGALQRHHGADHPLVDAARRDLRAAELEEHVRRIAAADPPLTAAQRTRIAALLTSPSPPRLRPALPLGEAAAAG